MQAAFQRATLISQPPSAAAEGRHRYVGRTLCISGIPACGLSELAYEVQQRLLETELTTALK